jgi:crotonobetainyl-CoA:carnitine CoA-transferase CaiB-like acyl-CoA transferase
MATDSARPGPLADLRVLDLTDELGRFATKLLAEAGASVVQAGPRVEAGRPMADPKVASRGGLCDWWLDGGKIRLAEPGDAARHRDEVLALARHADLVIDSRAPGALARQRLDYAELSAVNPALVQVSLTPFGLTGPRAHWKGSDLVAAAMGGVSSLTGPPEKPLNSWGRQNYAFGGFAAALCGLSGVWSARRTGRGAHVDLSLQEVVAGSLENIFFQYWFDDLVPLPKVAPRQGSLHWAGLYKVVPAKTGSVMITPTPVPEPLFQWMAEDGFAGAKEFLGLEALELIPRVAEIMQMISEWTLGHDASTLWEEAQRRHIAFGEVQSVAKVAQNPQFAHRGFFRDVDWDGPEVRRPGYLARLSGTPIPAPKPPPAGPTPLEDVLAEWARDDAEQNDPLAGGAPGDRKPLEGVKVVDFTWVLAGPFATRMLGDLGADILKFQTEERATQVNKDDYPYYYCWNRSKRSVMLDMKHPDALGVIRRVIEQADVIIENYAAGVLARLGLDWETVHGWNPRIVYVTMSGCGHDGPWRTIISYAPTVHALSGLTYLTNPADRRDIGPGFSLNDHAAGFAAATLVLEGLLARDRTGEGQYIDLAQLEVGSYLIGPALLDYFANGHETEPAGNADAFVDQVPNETYPCTGGEWVAVTARDDAEWQALCQVIGRADLASEPSLRTVEGRVARRGEVDAAVAAWCASRSAENAMTTLQEGGVPAGRVQDAASLSADPHLAARGFLREFPDHPHFGTRPFDRFPALWSTSSLEPYLRSPYFGEHMFEIYSELAGLSEAEIAEGIGNRLFT